MTNSPAQDPKRSTSPRLTDGTEGDTSSEERPLATLARDTTADNPWPLHMLSQKLHQYIARCDPMWVEGQIIELKKRARVTYLTLRDLEEEISVPVSLFPRETAMIDGELEHGMRVVVRLKPDFWTKTGRLSMLGSGIRQVGLGDMLERIERLRRSLQAEGLFDPGHKSPLPVLPQRIGLITGRDSDAEKDVIRNARLRWPGANFEVREVAVQGVHALSQVTAALQELDEDPAVDVIVIARGGGAMEDLLPFSEEAMIRAVYQARTPVVSAIGHEADQPLLDYVADWRASTPTDASKTVVPDVEEERLRIAQARAATERTLRTYLDRESQALAQFRSRPVLAHPETILMAREEETDSARQRAFRAVSVSLDRHREAVTHLRSRVRSLSPQKTLDRGYAVVQNMDAGTVVRDAEELSPGGSIRVRVASGGFDATVDSLHTDDPRDQ